MSYIIKHIRVEGLWGIKSFDTKFNEGINVIIGKNGSNKTVLLSLIESCLMVELNTLRSVQFKRILLVLCDEDGKADHLTVERIVDDGFVYISYLLSGMESVNLRFMEDEDERFLRMHDMRSEKVIRIREMIRQKINMSWLSVDRASLNLEGRHPVKNAVDQKLMMLLQELAVYRLRLLEMTNKLARELNAQAIGLLLYDENTDNIDLEDAVSKFASMDTKLIQSTLFRVFNQLGNVQVMKTKIQNHVAKLSGAIDRVKRRESLSMNDVAALILIQKTLSIMDLSKKHKDNVDEIMEPISIYERILARFMKDKMFSFSEDRGELEISWKNIIGNQYHVAEISPNKLSSGEKQLLILMTQTLLQEKRPYIFIADEPELSLHIEWQKNILGAIHEINPKAQVIVATHSPEIAGQWCNCIISMESITSYE